jgi:membrane associated rhomboid family serine protease
MSIKSIYNKSSQSGIPGFDHNAVLQLIVASGVGYVAYNLIWVIIRLGEPQSMFFFTHIKPSVVLPPVHLFLSKFWTVLTYGWVHNGFWELFSNMIWLYTFGSVVQMLVGYKQVIPLFIYALVIGGLFYEVSQLLPGDVFRGREAMLGAQAGIIALAVAALTIAPSYRFYFTPTFSIPIVVVACIFFALAVMNSNLEGPGMMLLAGGSLTGYLYIILLQRGKKPGAWMYDIFDTMERSATPDVRASYKHQVKRNTILKNLKSNPGSVTQSRVDDILDKINQKGFDALTKEERDILNRAGKENS